MNTSTAFRTAVIVAIVSASAFLPAGMETSQPLVICADGYADGDYLVRVRVKDGVGEVLGLAKMVDLAGNVVGEKPPEDPDDPGEPEDPTTPNTALEQVETNMAVLGKLDWFKSQVAALKLALSVPATATTRASAYNIIVGSVTVIVGGDQKAWEPWFLPLIKSLEAEKDLDKFTALVDSARKGLE